MRTRIVIAMIVMATSTGVFAQRNTIRLVAPPKQAVTFAERWRPKNGNGQTKIIGKVIDIRMVAVGKAKVQLRNLDKGTVEQAKESDANGEYEFDIDHTGTYVVEMVLVDGKVLALSNAGSLSQFETMRTVVQLPGRWDSQVQAMSSPQSMTSFVGMSSLATMTATTITLAVDANIAPVNSGEPVSPVSPVSPR